MILHLDFSLASTEDALALIVIAVFVFRLRLSSNPYRARERSAQYLAFLCANDERFRKETRFFPSEVEHLASELHGRSCRRNDLPLPRHLYNSFAELTIFLQMCAQPMSAVARANVWTMDERSVRRLFAKHVELILNVLNAPVHPNSVTHYTLSELSALHHRPIIPDPFYRNCMYIVDGIYFKTTRKRNVWKSEFFSKYKMMHSVIALVLVDMNGRFRHARIYPPAHVSEQGLLQRTNVALLPGQRILGDGAYRFLTAFSAFSSRARKYSRSDCAADALPRGVLSFKEATGFVERGDSRINCATLGRR